MMMTTERVSVQLIEIEDLQLSTILLISNSIYPSSSLILIEDDDDKEVWLQESLNVCKCSTACDAVWCGALGKILLRLHIQKAFYVLDLVSAGGKADLFINTIKQKMLNCIGLDNGEAKWGISSSSDIKDCSYHQDGDEYALCSVPSDKCVDGLLEGSLRLLDICSTAKECLLVSKESLHDLHSVIRRRKDVLLHERQENWVDEILDGSLRLLDVCTSAKDALLHTKECARELHSIIRRKRGGEVELTAESSSLSLIKDDDDKQMIASQFLKLHKLSSTCDAMGCGALEGHLWFPYMHQGALEIHPRDHPPISLGVPGQVLLELGVTEPTFQCTRANLEG
ncbi:unnamed protein product [Sphenostylis stenocarpa]|uniref:Uncharacterized protein n=1 Tax=Sphenostylis stenocarpa TaxID=92480 RepID=A0AA86T726_9FABA|nr:unnamed protein product [Sphenostylis stenocarpa]